MGRVMIYNLLRFVALVVLQVILFKNIGYYNLVTAFPYILFILLLPIGISNFFLFVLAFATGITIDAFYDSLGIHAAACVALAWFRIFFDRITLEVEVRQSFNTPTWSEMGFKWYSSYVFFGTIVHHFTFFMVETFSFQNFLYTIISIILSSLFTFVLIMLMSLLFFKRKSRI